MRRTDRRSKALKQQDAIVESIKHSIERLNLKAKDLEAQAEKTRAGAIELEAQLRNIKEICDTEKGE